MDQPVNINGRDRRDFTVGGAETPPPEIAAVSLKQDLIAWRQFDLAAVKHPEAFGLLAGDLEFAPVPARRVDFAVLDSRDLQGFVPFDVLRRLVKDQHLADGKIRRV